ncbi:MAG TPA: AmmeMemoRadiSam system protein B [Methylomirabilota bacterium]|nr:AmmeMemoRadiSam system protein B [Methylomirabilota bacterium]
MAEQEGGGRGPEPGLPRLRPLEAFPIEQDGQRLIGLRDPAGFTDQVAVLGLPLLDLVSLFDGQHSVPEIQAVLRARYREAPTIAQIAQVIDRLDEAGFLESRRFAERRRAIEEAFRSSPVRASVHAGGAYAGEARALAAQIESFFSGPEAPGAIEYGGPDTARPRRRTPGNPGAPFFADVPMGQPLRGLIAPHIDFHRGGPTYAWAYRELLARSDADLFVILGTCHAGMEDPFAATLKPFQTPLGPVTVDREFAEALGRRARQDLLASELAHRSEHSIEFQAVMLQWLLGGRRPFAIVPVLASFLHEAVWTRMDPEGDRRVPRFIDALGETMAATRRRVCLIAGVDLAHVGPRFGDPGPNTPEVLRDVEVADRQMLEAVTAGAPTEFYGAVVHDGDSRRICGLSPIYTFLRALPGVQGRLLRYSLWPDPEGAVSFCAAAFP